MDTVTPNIPAVASVAVEFPPHRHSQDEVMAMLSDFAGPEFARFAANSGVATRQLALPLSRYSELRDFTEANDAYLEVALDLSERLCGPPWTKPACPRPTSTSCSRRR